MLRTRVDIPANALTQAMPIDTAIGMPLADAFGTEITGITDMVELYILFAAQGTVLLRNAGINNPFDVPARLSHVFRPHTRESMLRGEPDTDVELLPMSARVVVPYTSQYPHDSVSELETGLPQHMTFGIVRPVRRGDQLSYRAAKTTLSLAIDRQSPTKPLAVRKDTQQLGKEITTEQVEAYLQQSKRSTIRSALLLTRAKRAARNQSA